MFFYLGTVFFRQMRITEGCSEEKNSLLMPGAKIQKCPPKTRVVKGLVANVQHYSEVTESSGGVG